MKPKKPGWEDRCSEFEISFINEPVEVEPVVVDEPKARLKLVVNNDRKEFCGNKDK
jgi:hypothetical protein